MNNKRFSIPIILEKIMGWDINIPQPGIKPQDRGAACILHKEPANHFG